jgi:hypothetical protein
MLPRPANAPGHWLIRVLVFLSAEPIPNTHGFGYNISADGFHNYSIVDTVVIPAGLQAGVYLISWRWDAEQTYQIWENWWVHSGFIACSRSDRPPPARRRRRARSADVRIITPGRT